MFLSVFYHLSRFPSHTKKQYQAIEMMPSLYVDHLSDGEFALAGSRGNRLTTGC